MPHQRDSELTDERLSTRFKKTRAQNDAQRARKDQTRKEEWASKVRQEAGSALPDTSQPSNDVPEQLGDSGSPDPRLSDSDNNPAPSKDSEVNSDETDPTEIDINDDEGPGTKLDKKRKEKSGLKARLRILEEKVEELEIELAEAKSQQFQAISDSVSKEDFDKVTTKVERLKGLLEESEDDKKRLRNELRECEQRIANLESNEMVNGSGMQNTNGVALVASSPGKSSGRRTTGQIRFERKKSGEKKKFARKGSVEIEVSKYAPV